MGERTGTGGEGAGGPPTQEAPCELATRQAGLPSRSRVQAPGPPPSCTPSASPPVRVFRSSQSVDRSRDSRERRLRVMLSPAGRVRRQRPAARHARAGRTKGGGWAPCRPPTRGTRTWLCPEPAVRLPACSARGRQTALGGVVLWCSGSPGPAPSLSPVPALPAGPQAQRLLSLRAGGPAWGLGPPRPRGAAPQVLKKTSKSGSPAPSLPGSGAQGSSLKRRSGSQVAMLPGGPGLQQEGPRGLSPACRAWRGWRLGWAGTGCGCASLGIAARPSHPGHAADCARPVWALGPQPQMEALESSRSRHVGQRSLRARRPVHAPPPVTWLGV